MKQLPEYLGRLPVHRWNAATGLFEASLPSAFSFVIPPGVYFGIFDQMKSAIVDFTLQQKLSAGEVIRIDVREG